VVGFPQTLWCKLNGNPKPDKDFQSAKRWGDCPSDGSELFGSWCARGQTFLHITLARGSKTIRRTAAPDSSYRCARGLVVWDN
jgi:hypothetical protein